MCFYLTLAESFAVSDLLCETLTGRSSPETPLSSIQRWAYDISASRHSRFTKHSNKKWRGLYSAKWLGNQHVKIILVT